MSSLINSSVFPGIQGGHSSTVLQPRQFPSMRPSSLSSKHIRSRYALFSYGQSIYRERLSCGIRRYGQPPHAYRLPLQFDLTGRVAKMYSEKPTLLNKNMVPFDSRSAFQTSGMRVGTPAVTSRGLVEKDMAGIVDMIDKVLSNLDDDNVIAQVKEQVRMKMSGLPLNRW